MSEVSNRNLIPVARFSSCLNFIFLSLAGSLMSGCAIGYLDKPIPIPKLAEAKPSTLSVCSALTEFHFERTKISSATLVSVGEVSVAEKPIQEHCLIKGLMNERTSKIDGQSYAIRFEVRLPINWNGRFLHQGNGGIDGVVAPALGVVGAGGVGQTNGLAMGFAVLSSDAGHSNAQNPSFGIDPQARRDYGYAAVGSLTPMAKALIKAAYGRAPDRAYFAGTSNGGRHAMVAASRYAEEYDGYFAQSPGFNIPRAAAAQLWGAQQWIKVAIDRNNLETAFTSKERQLVSYSILKKCDGLDGLVDGMVNDYKSCKREFDIQRDVPNCVENRNDRCLTVDQKKAFSAVFNGPITRDGRSIYSDWPVDPGLVAPNWAQWKFKNSVGPNRDPVSSIIFSVPPEPEKLKDTLDYALNFSIENDWPKFSATDSIYLESALEIMTPPNLANLDRLRNRGAKMIIVHGEADGVFSANDTAKWMDALNRNYQGDESNFVRYFRVPGMNHSGNGPATDQYNGLQILVDWVEHGIAPKHIVAQVRGAGNPMGMNADLPTNWSPVRSRPLCPYPTIARYKVGDPERADSFVCIQ